MTLEINVGRLGLALALPENKDGRGWRSRSSGGEEGG